MSSYNRIAAVKTTVAVLRHLADQKQPVSGQDVARALGLPHGTVMCHLVTLEDERLVRSVGGAWELDMGLALFWARKKSQLQGQIARAADELNQLEV
ncbi:MAG: helix-turn-helix domain-containing protein [Desulfuromonadales bacterium]|nr:helix-turn-helix domain-containing protein [Desulfuromonadales bacterium]